MQDYSDIREIRETCDPVEANNLLANWWRLLGISKDEDFKFKYSIGRCFYKSLDEFRGACG